MLRQRRHLHFVCLAIAVCLLAGCGVRDEEPLPPAFAHADGPLAWQGVRRCVDCDAVESQLILSWAGGDRRYQWIDTYFSAGEAMPFGIEGTWRHEGSLIMLEDDAGAWHALRLLDDGRLQPRDVSGRGVGGGEADMLVPMGVVDVD